MSQDRVIQGSARAGELSTNKVLRNTYMLLSLTLLFSALTAGLAMVLQVGHIAGLVTLLAGFGVLFAIHRYAESTTGLWLTFLFTGLLGFSLGPIISTYLTVLSNGGEIVMMALGGTGVIFLGLSGYALTTKKDFSFLQGFLMVGILMAVVASFATLFFNVPMFSLALSGVFVLLMSGLILYQTSQIIHGGETNYILATISLYVALYNLFTSLLHILAVFAGQR
ncbi:MAG: Bax inhibitor-1/YccA family protein [Halofilum sp. (in: g-proteobacteria)]|nr:Bax inhibitor-1/YccA family protein [Halofilum sp. (in: g-proteobacteria)]